MSDGTGVNIIELSGAQRPDPMPQVQRGQDWVKLGENNDYFEGLMTLYNESNLHRSIVSGIVDRVKGEGLTIPNRTHNANAFAALRSFVSNYELNKIAMEEVLFGVFALRLTTNNAGTAIASVECVSMVNLRPEKANDEGEVEAWYYSRDWQHYRKSEFTPERIPVFDFEATRQRGEFIYVFSRYEPGVTYVPNAPYAAGISWMQADTEIAKYHLSNIQTGFSGLTAVVFKNGEPTIDVQRRIESKFKKKFTGASGDKVVFLYAEPDQDIVEFKTIDLTDADKQYELLSKEINQRVMFAHRVTSPILLGIKDDTGLGNNAEEMQNANSYFEKLVIRPKRNFITAALERILTYNGIAATVQLKPLVLIEATEGEQTPVELKDEGDDERKVLTDEDQDYLMDYFDQYGESEEDLLNVGYKVVSEEDVEPGEQIKIKGEQLRSLELSDFWGLRPDKLSKYDVRAPDKSGTWLVRYQYALGLQEQLPEIIETSRKFCRHMIDLKNNSNRIYKREVIEQLQNPEFGSYDIWRYKGSYNCRHRWRRKLFFKPVDSEQVNRVGNVPYVINRLNDKRATRVNTKPSR